MSDLYKKGQNSPLSVLIFMFSDQYKVSGCSFKHHDNNKACNINCIIKSALLLMYKCSQEIRATSGRAF